MRRRRRHGFRRFIRGFFKMIFFLALCVGLAVGGTYVYNHYIKEPGIPSVNKLVKEKKENNFSDKDDNKIIVTTIQKLNNLMKSESDLSIYQKHVVSPILNVISNYTHIFNFVKSFLKICVFFVKAFANA